MIQARPAGAATTMTIHGRVATVSLGRGVDGELVLWAGALQSEAARLLLRRTEEATRRLGMRATVATDDCQVARA
ncbi:MAG: hypothetical protein M3O34_14670 [Chloroflexota bacterium]|nr:hypothetical protein [Chloroflexota bacterium]